jgi:hypothetical protein
VATVAITGCGKKGAPLAPIVHIPAAVDKLSAQRVGNDIYLTVTIPTQNIDTSTPADVSRIDIFGVTTLTTPPRTRIFEIATRVATIDVQPAPQPGQPPPSPTGQQPQLPVQGTTVTVRDALTAADLIPKELPPATTRGALPPVAPASPPAAAPTVPRRSYIAVAVSDRGRSGPPGTLLDLLLQPLPDPPGQLTSTYNEDAVTITWESSGGVVGFLFETPVPIEAAPVDEPADAAAPPLTPAPSGPTMYNVYREVAPDNFRPEAPTGATSSSVTPPVPLNAAPLAALTYSDVGPIAFGQQRCYTVRAVRGVTPNVVLSEPSERLCITPEDVFPPAAPTALTSIAAEGVISLLWEPNGEADLGGYVVLRGRPGDATLQPLTDMPVKDVQYEDRDVMAGVRYVYAVRAVDTHQPRPNVSEASNRVEETAR